MKSLRRIYLSLGTNLGDRIQNLQSAVDQLQEHVGKIIKCSAVYSSTSWGFKSEDFLNICLSINTHLSALEVLQAILSIEADLGRIREKTQGYIARSIDIDILFYEDDICDSPQLKIPHPSLHLRKFVLEPLATIAPEKTHPVSRKSITQLLEECPDESIVTLTTNKLFVKDNIDFSAFNFIAIEGNIGSGKTTLATKIAQDFNGKLILERFADNPFLPKFYEDKDRYAFPLEMSFLADRYQQFTDDIAQLDLFKDFMVSDYDIHKSLIFAKITLSEEEFTLYRKIFDFIYKKIKQPDIYIYLYKNTEKLLENIKKRGRTYEQNIPVAYLEKINTGHLEFMKTQPNLNNLVIDTSHLDFVKSEADYQYILKKILNIKS